MRPLLSLLLCTPALGQDCGAKLLPPDLEQDDHLGTTVAISGEFALSGAPGTPPIGPKNGRVWVWRGDGAEWVLDAELLQGDGSAGGGDGFGIAVDIDGPRAVVGAYLAPDAAIRPGAAYVYRHEAGGWVFEQKLIAPDATHLQSFGVSVDLDGERLLIGACEDDEVISGAGAAYVFEHQAGLWTFVHKMLPSDGGVGDAFGISVALDDERAAVGNLDSDVYAFRRDAAGWIEEQILTVPVTLDFGFKLALENERLVTSAELEADNSGRAYVYERNAGVWSQQALLVSPNSAAFDEFGSDIALYADRIAVGAAGDSIGGPFSGALYLFERDAGGTWNEAGTLLAADGQVNESFGRSVHLDGEALAVGARTDGDAGHQSGSAYAYDLRAPIGVSYCGPAVANSSGLAAELHALGSEFANDADLVLRACQLPSGEFGYFVASLTQGFVGQPPGSQGNLCLGGQIARFVAQVRKSGPTGGFAVRIDTSAIPTSPPSPILPGDTWSFQAWFRDRNPGPTSNFTDGRAVTFQ